MKYRFRWNDWNIEHIAEHGVTRSEVEAVVNGPRAPWPEKIGGGKWRVWGRTFEGRHLQVIYIFDPAPTVFVIHARDLSENEKRQYRRRRH